MTLDQLRYFFEAARFQHVGKAARFVHISPSAISAAIAALESELGCALFDRKGKSIVLTDQGKRLRDEAERLFDQVSGISKAIRGSANQLRGNYRLGASHFLASHFLARAWSQLQNRHAELVGDLCSLPTAQVLEELISGALDFGLCFSPFQHPELKQTIVHRGQLLVAVRTGHSLLKLSGQKALAQLKELPAVIHKGQPGVELCEAHPIFARYGITPRIRFTFDSDLCAVERVSSSESWTLVPDLVAKAFPKQIKTIVPPKDWDAPYTVAWVHRNGREKNPVIQEAQQILTAAFS